MSCSQGGEVQEIMVTANGCCNCVAQAESHATVADWQCLSCSMPCHVLIASVLLAPHSQPHMELLVSTGRLEGLHMQFCDAA